MADCTNAQIKVTAISPPGGGAAGHVGVVLLFTNTSSATCSMTGYPGVDGLNSAGQKLASATRTLNGMIGFCGCTKPPVVTLTPGHRCVGRDRGRRRRLGTVHRVPVAARHATEHDEVDLDHVGALQLRLHRAPGRAGPGRPNGRPELTDVGRG